MLQRTRKWASRVKRRLSWGVYRLLELLNRPWLFFAGFIAFIAVLIHIAYLYTAIFLIIAAFSIRVYMRWIRRAMAKRRLR